MENNSADWDSVYSSVSNTSADWDSVYTSVENNSADWDSVYSTVNTNSGTWLDENETNTLYLKLSGGTITYGLSVNPAGVNDNADFVVRADADWYASGNVSAYPRPLIFASPATNKVGINTSTPAYMLDVNGDIQGQTGYFTHIAAGTKSFYINHPNPAKVNKHLQYGSLESPYHGIRLTGKGTIKGTTATVQLPDYIPYLIRTEDMNIQLTNNKHKHTLWVDEVYISTDPLVSYFTIGKKNNLFDNKTYEFFWSFSAIRKDIPHLQVED